MSSKLRQRINLDNDDLIERALREVGVGGGMEAVLMLELTGDVDDETAARVAGAVGQMLEADHENRATLQRRAAAGQLGAGVVHEVRNILAGIRGFAQVAVADGTDAAKRDELLRRLERETGRCLDTVSRFLRFARDNTNRRDDIDVNALVREAAQLLAPHARTKRIRIVTQLDEHLEPIWGNRGELLQVLVNLGLNGQQAMPDGGTLQFVSLGLDDDSIALRVDDGGPGVPSELRDRIFEPFFTTRRDSGTGLGLALCREIAEAHGGSLTLRDQSGGASFQLALPRASGESGENE